MNTGGGAGGKGAKRFASCKLIEGPPSPPSPRTPNTKIILILQIHFQHSGHISSAIVQCICFWSLQFYAYNQKNTWRILDFEKPVFFGGGGGGGGEGAHLKCILSKFRD